MSERPTQVLGQLIFLLKKNLKKRRIYIFIFNFSNQTSAADTNHSVSESSTNLSYRLGVPILILATQTRQSQLEILIPNGILLIFFAS